MGDTNHSIFSRKTNLDLLDPNETFELYEKRANSPIYTRNINFENMGRQYPVVSQQPSAVEAGKFSILSILPDEEPKKKGSFIH